MSIYKAIFKYSHSNFILEIIEYCDPVNVISREQFYLDNFDFYYNQLSKANSSLGFKHSSVTLAKMKGRKNALGLKHTATTKKKLSLISSSAQHTEDSLFKMRELWALRKFKKEQQAWEELSALASPSQQSNCLVTESHKAPHTKKVIVKNIEDNTFKTYNSITEASKFLNLTRSTLRNYINNQNILTILRKTEDNKIKKEKLLITWLGQ